MRLDFKKIWQELKEETGDNIISGRLGKTGACKTLRQNEEEVIPMLLDGLEVYCCYFLNYELPNLHYFHPRDFDKVKNLRNSVIVFDEIRRSFDPRGWQMESEELRGFVELHRHRHNDIIFNTQDISLVAKTFGIQTHYWEYLEKIERGKILGMWDKITENEKIRTNISYLSFQQLKKLANGWELGEDVVMETKGEIKKYEIKEILHRELNEIKIELIHRYCPKCKSRQGEQILRKDTEKEAEKIGEFEWISKKRGIMCPKHKETELIIRESAMFDTDYEPEPNKEIFRIVKYKTCQACGKDHIIQ